MRLGVAAALVGGELVAGDVSVEDGRIEGVGLPGAGTGTAVPGFVDVQVNGFAGVDFLTASPADYVTAAEALAATGVTAYLPTFITAPPDAYRDGLAMLADAPGVIGAHLEGPFLSPDWPGAHPPHHLRAPDLALVDELRALGLRFEIGEEDKPVEGPLTGKTYVITGTLEGFTRDEAAAALEELGAKVGNSVSSKTTGLVVGEEPGKSKLTKAEKTGVPQLSEQDLLELLGRS